MCAQACQAKKGLEISRMAPHDMETVLDWATQEGWNPGLKDGPAFYAADPGGFLLGSIDGEPVGSLSAVSYGSHYGFMGLYMVRPEFRGQGFGLQLWERGLDMLGGRVIGLDAVLGQKDNYARHGFKPSFHSIRCQGVGWGMAPPSVCHLNEINWGQIESYDHRCFPDTRANFLKAWLDQPGTSAFGIKREGRCRGYGVIRPCREGYKIGPLFAGDELAAEDLFQALCAQVPGNPFYLDVPQNNHLAVALAKRHGLEPVFETVRMYRGGEPPWADERVFGITSFELG